MDFCAGQFEQKRRVTSAQLLLIVSDGRGVFAQGMERARLAVQRFLASRQVFVVFVILDNPANKANCIFVSKLLGNDPLFQDSIVDIKVPIFDPTSSKLVELKPYLELLPFPFYLIVRRLNELPAVLGEALRQWFQMLGGQSG